MKTGIVVAALLAGAAAAGVASLSGTWKLNVEKSSWGRARKPATVVIEIDHREPVLKYHGTISYVNEDTREFVFDGAIDGKEYALIRSYGAGKVRVERINDNSIVSTFRTDDGRYVETTRNSVSRDGKIMTRRINVQGPDGDTRWTEVYEKR